jgi:dolichyl-phosphate-mannose--protein O-mannosyl transferase
VYCGVRVQIVTTVVVCLHVDEAVLCPASQLAPLMFRIAKELGCRDVTAFLASCFITFDMLNTIESRLVLMDAQLMFHSALALLLGIMFLKRFEAASVAKDFNKNFDRWYVAIGFVCGCAICIKWCVWFPYSLLRTC